jgi:hypothetical protein
MPAHTCAHSRRSPARSFRLARDDKEYRRVYFLPVEPGVGFAFVRLDPKDETTGSLGFTALGFFASRLPRLFSFDMVFPR